MACSAAEGALRGETWALADLLGDADAEAGVTRTDLASLALSCSGDSPKSLLLCVFKRTVIVCALHGFCGDFTLSANTVA